MFYAWKWRISLKKVDEKLKFWALESQQENNDVKGNSNMKVLTGKERKYGKAKRNEKN